MDSKYPLANERKITNSIRIVNNWEVCKGDMV